MQGSSLVSCVLFASLSRRFLVSNKSTICSCRSESFTCIFQRSSLGSSAWWSKLFVYNSWR